MLDDLINEKASKGWELVTWEIFSQLTGIENVARKEPEQGQPLMPRLLPDGRSANLPDGLPATYLTNASQPT